MNQLESLKLQVVELQAKIARIEANTSNKWEPPTGKFWINSYGKVDTGVSTPGTQRFGIERNRESVAASAAIKMRQFNRLLAYHDEFCPDNTEGYIVYYSHVTGIWKYTIPYVASIVDIHFTEDVAAELVKKLNAGVVIF